MQKSHITKEFQTNTTFEITTSNNSANSTSSHIANATEHAHNCKLTSVDIASTFAYVIINYYNVIKFVETKKRHRKPLKTYTVINEQLPKINNSQDFLK